MPDLTRATQVDTDVDLEIVNLFTYHPWDEKQKASGDAVRNILATAYGVIIANVPPCPTRTRALNKLIDARMDANSAITHGGKY